MALMDGGVEEGEEDGGRGTRDGGCESICFSPKWRRQTEGMYVYLRPSGVWPRGCTHSCVQVHYLVLLVSS